MIPKAIRRTDEGLTVDWDGEGHSVLFPARFLRLECPCAVCVAEMTGERILDPDTIPADIRPMNVRLVGAYGLRVTWSDGHHTGIYTYDRLRRTCPCKRCAADAGSSPGSGA